jgi:hypothetical protein
VDTGLYNPAILSEISTGLMQLGRTVTPLVWGCASFLYASDDFDSEDCAHWAFQKLKNPELPQVQNRKSVRNGVDAFILVELEKQNIPSFACATGS